MPLITFSGCEPCSLRKEWPWLHTPQMPVSVPKEASDYRVMMVGEGPGETEDSFGTPFVGKTGKYLRNEIPGYWKDKLYWTNCVRCRPPKNRTPTTEEVSCCSVYQERDLDIIKPQAILAIGDIALKYFWPTAWVTGMRGIPFPIELGDGFTSWCVTTFHPSYVTRQERKDDAGNLVNTMLPVFRNDIRNFFDRIPYFANNPPTIQRPPKEKFHYPTTKQQALNLFSQLKQPFCVDLETFKLKPYMRDARIIVAGFSDGETTFSFPVNWPSHPSSMWGMEAFQEMMLRGGRWIAQHANFEYAWIWDATKTHQHDFDDIEVLARLIHKKKGVGSLDDLSRIYLGIDIKALTGIDKNRLLDYPIEKVLEYNAIDAWAEKLIFDILIKIALADPNIIDNYYRILAATKSTVGMELDGLTVDLTEGERLQKDIYVKLRQYEQDAEKIPEVIEFKQKEKKFFSLSSDETVGHVLVMYCGIDLPKTDSQKQYSTSQDFLEPLAGKHPLVDLRLDFKEVQKLASTYIDPILSGALLGKDGLLHPQYTTVHTATYRLSSELPNIQNFPKRKNRHIRRQVVAPPGYILAAFDYGQLEARVLCMFSKDPNLSLAMTEQAKAIAAGDEAKTIEYDIHWKWLYRIIDIYPEYMDRLAKVSGETAEKAILKGGRTIIKTDFVFATFYGSQVRSLSARTGIPLDKMEVVWNEFWSEYSKAKEWVDAQFVQYFETGQVASITGRIRNEVLPGNEVINTPVQGSAAELVIEAQNALFFKSIEEDKHLKPRINIHDDLLFIFPDGNDLEQYITTTGQEIVAVRFPFINVPLMTECRVGYNWCDLSAVVSFTGDYIV